MDSAVHRRLTGVANETIIANLARLAGVHHGIQVRVPCITGLNDDEAHIERLAVYVAGTGIRHLTLLPYNGAAGAKYRWIDRGFPLDGTETQSGETMQRLAEIGRRCGLDVAVGG